MDITATVYYSPDYRSCPSGIGHINIPGEKAILVTDGGCGPKDMEEAKIYIREEYLPAAVEHIALDFGEKWEEAQGMLTAILRKHSVEYVYDVEMGYHYNSENPIFTLDSWLYYRS